MERFGLRQTHQWGGGIRRDVLPRGVKDTWGGTGGDIDCSVKSKFFYQAL